MVQEQVHWAIALRVASFESNSWKAFKGFFGAMKNQLEKLALLLADTNGRVADLRSIKSKSVTKAVIGYSVYKKIFISVKAIRLTLQRNFI